MGTNNLIKHKEILPTITYPFIKFLLTLVLRLKYISFKFNTDLL